MDVPTRGSNILDLFFTNRPQLINRLTVIPGISDHDAIFIDTNICAPRKKPPIRSLRMWGKANILNIKSKCAALSSTIINLISETKHPSVNTIWTTFRDGCNHIIQDEVPSRQSSQRFSQPWISREIRRISRRKRRWFSRAKKSGKSKDWEKYKVLKRQAQHACRQAHNNHICNMLSENCDNPKVFWTYIKSRRKDTQGVSSLKKTDLHIVNLKQKPIYWMSNSPLYLLKKIWITYLSYLLAPLPQWGTLQWKKMALKNYFKT